MTKKIGILIGIITLVIVLAVAYVVIDAKKKSVQLDKVKDVYIKLADPAIYSDSPIEEFNHIDPAAEELHLKAIEFSQISQLEQAIKLLKQALDNYQGFHGYHYFDLKRNLALFYKTQGNDDLASILMQETEDGQLNLLKQESGSP